MKSSPYHLIVAVTMCVAAIVGYGIWYATISAKSSAVADLQNQIDTKTETVSRIAATRATLADVANDEATVQAYFVPETNVVAFINSLETYGKTLGAKVSVLSVSKGGTAAQPALALSLSANGTFDAVMRTIGAIEFAPYDISISSLSVAQDDTNAWHADVKLVVSSVLASRMAATTAAIPIVAVISPPSRYAY